MKLLLLGAATLFLAACGGDSTSASGGGTIATEGSSITQVDVVPGPTTTAGGSASGTNAQGECSESSRAEGIC